MPKVNEKKFPSHDLLFEPFLGMVFLRFAALAFAIFEVFLAAAFFAAAFPLAVYGNFFPLTFGITFSLYFKTFIF